jgi:AraC-like DNA-binding protein
MDYREVAPPPDLRRHLAGFWHLRGPAPIGRPWPGTAADAAAPAGEPILPDGRCEIVLHRASPFERLEAGRWRRQPPALWAGQLLGPLTLRPAGPSDLFGVRFTPWGAAALLGGHLVETTGAIVPLRDALPGFASALEDAAAKAASLGDFAGRAATILGPGFGDNSVDPLVEEAAFLLESRARLVEAVAGQLGVSRRQLERRFLKEVGLPPKRYARIVRFQRLLSVLREAPIGGAAGAAIDLDYADQPHAIREFREFAGASPSALLADMPRLTALFAGWSNRD